MAIRVKGTVERLFVNSDSCYIRLAGLPSADTPKDGYFQLKSSHPNYGALYSLALVAAVNRFELDVRTAVEIDPSKESEVVYFVLDW